MKRGSFQEFEQTVPLRNGSQNARLAARPIEAHPDLRLREEPPEHENGTDDPLRELP
jgi:hypothetical protein